MQRAKPEELAQLAQGAEQIARSAGKIIAEFYERICASKTADPKLNIRQKADQSPVTAADEAADAHIVAQLQRLTPTLLVVSEESPSIAFEQRKDAELIWLVDPLDGTREFVAQTGEFCVCVALIENGEPIIGIIHSPVQAKSWAAYRGGGAFRVDADGEWRVLRKRTPYRLSDVGLRVALSRHHLGKQTQEFVATLLAPQGVTLGSALKFCAIAEGELDLYPRFGETMEWDIAAGHCLLCEIGGEVVSTETGQRLRYNKADLRNPPFIAKLDSYD